MHRIKRKINIVFSIVLIPLLLTSCYTCWVRKVIPKDVRASMKDCYDSLPSGLDTIIPIHGYYVMTQYYKEWDNKLEKSVPASKEIKFMFYSDGFFSWRDVRWGNYFVDGDTIKTFYYEAPCGQSWGGNEKWFLINKDSTLTYFYYSPMRNENKEQEEFYREEREIHIGNNTKAKFIYTDSIPDINDKWILEAKWFRCK